jgi:DNA-binding NarL/FixJ family response regulator
MVRSAVRSSRRCRREAWRREIKTKLPQSAIVILSVNADQRLIEEAKKIGARAYVAKSKAAEALIQAIEAAIAGGDFVLVAQHLFAR